MQQAMTQSDRLIRFREVMNLTGWGRTSIYRLVEEGRFPKPCKIGLRSVAWKESEIQKYIETAGQ